MPKSRVAGALEVDHTVDALRSLIVDGDLAPGERLVERPLAERLGTSRVPVREALQRLVADGFAASRPTGGVVVRQHDDEEVAELLEISHALDAVAARRLQRAGTDLAPLHEVLAATRRALDVGDHVAAVASNARFHEVLTDLSPAPVVRETSAPVRRLLDWLMRQHADAAVVHDEHVALVEALASDDAERLESVLRQHARTSLAAWEATR